MNGWTASKQRDVRQPGANETDFVVKEAMTVSAQGARHFRVNVVTTVTAGTITYSLEQKIGDSWVAIAGANANPAATTSTGTTTMKQAIEDAVDLPNLPLGSAIRLIATTDASWDGVIERVEHLQGL